MEQETTTPGRGSNESAEWFRARLEELHISQSEFARVLQRWGDDRQFTTILRSLSRMASGDARVSGEMRAQLNMMIHIRRDNGRRLNGLRQELEMLTSGVMRTHETVMAGQIDTTEKSVLRVRSWIDQIMALPPALVALEDEAGE